MASLKEPSHPALSPKTWSNGTSINGRTHASVILKFPDLFVMLFAYREKRRNTQCTFFKKKKRDFSARLAFHFAIDKLPKSLLGAFKTNFSQFCCPDHIYMPTCPTKSNLISAHSQLNGVSHLTAFIRFSLSLALSVSVCVLICELPMQAITHFVTMDIHTDWRDWVSWKDQETQIVRQKMHFNRMHVKLMLIITTTIEHWYGNMIS